MEKANKQNSKLRTSILTGSGIACWKYIFSLVLIVCIGISSFGQNSWPKTINGTVSDEKGLPIPGVTVMVEGSLNGVVTSMEGEYSIKVADPKKVLVFSFVGFTKVSRVVGTQSKIDVILNEEVVKLDDVVVVGYGSQKRNALVGSVADVSGKTLTSIGIPNLSRAIQDALPGAIATVSSGQPGVDDASIVVRGAATFTGSNAPLILIDGIEATGGFSQVDPTEVSSVSVLKDASATAVYGVRGANGVILITTRRGALGAPRISVSGDVTMKMVPNLEPTLKGYDLLALDNEAKKNSGSFQSLRKQSLLEMYQNPNRDPYLYPNVDWYDELIKKTGWENNVRMNVTGGTNLVKYFTSMSYAYQGDIMKTDSKDGFYDPSFNFDKFNFRTNLDFQITRTTKLNTDISGRTERINRPNVFLTLDQFNNYFKQLAIVSPVLMPVYYPAEFVAQHPDLATKPGSNAMRYSWGLSDDQLNPYTLINQSGFVKDKKDVIDINIGLDQQLDFVTKGLSASFKYSYSTQTYYTKTYSKLVDSFFYQQGATASDPGSWYLVGWNNTLSTDTNPVEFHPSAGENFSANIQSTYYEGKLLYNRTFNEVHNVTGTGVFSRQIRKPNLDIFPTYREDWVGRGTYNYKEKYILEANGSYTGSEKFAPGKRFGFFYSGAIGWNVAKENFVVENLPWINTFKLRYSYGKNGSDNGDRFMYEGGWGKISLGFPTIGFGNPLVSANSSGRYGQVKLANPDATWEKAYSQNFGLDAKFFNKLSINAEFYQERREDIFLNPGTAIPTYLNAGYGRLGVGLPLRNAGKTKRHGLELSADYKDVLFDEVNYSVGGNINFAENRIVYQMDVPGYPDYQKNAGKPIGWQSGLQTEGYLNNFEEAINATPVSGALNVPGQYRFADFNGDGTINGSDAIPMGTTQPMATYGFNFGLSYKGFDFRARFYGKTKTTYSAASEFWYPAFSGQRVYGREVQMDRWTPDNKDALYPSYLAGAVSTVAYAANRHNQRYVDCRYLRLQSVTLSYNASSPWLRNSLKINSLIFRLSGSDLLTFSNLKYGGDPEGGNGLSFNYPLLKRIDLGVDINF